MSLSSLPVVEAEYTMHAEHMIDDIIRQHDVQSDVTKLLVVTGQMRQNALMNLLKIGYWL